MGFIAAVIFALILFHHFKPPTVGQHPKPTLDFVSRAHISEAPIPDMAKEAIIGRTITSELQPVPTSVAEVPDADERLRVFDEL
jgi:hypothetical protein